MDSAHTLGSPQLVPTSACRPPNNKPRHIPLKVDYKAVGNDAGDGRDFDVSKIPPVKISKREKIRSLFRSSKSKDAVPDRPRPSLRVMLPAVLELGSEIVVSHDRVRDDDQRAVLEDPNDYDINGNRVAPITDRNFNKTKRAVIVDLKHEPTFSEVSTVCKNTGKIEKIEIDRTHNYARVWFLEEAGAVRLMEHAQLKITYATADSNYQRCRTKFIDVKYNWPIENLHPNVLARIARDGITRCVVIRGLTRSDMASVLGIRDNFGNNNMLLLWNFASYITPQATGEVEAAQAQYINGAWESMIIYTDILVAISAYDSMRDTPQLVNCTLWFGVDPCEPQGTIHAL